MTHLQHSNKVLIIIMMRRLLLKWVEKVSLNAKGAI